jgi:hypothetical protein
MSDSEQIRISPVVSFARDLSAGLHPAIALGAFSVALFMDVWFRLAVPPASTPEWAWQLGRTLGSLFAVAVPFALWVYFVVVVFLSLSVLGKFVDMRKLGDILGIAFGCATLGKVGEFFLRSRGEIVVGPWVYGALAIGGLVLAAYGIRTHLRVSAAAAATAMGIALGGIVFLSWRWFY